MINDKKSFIIFIFTLLVVIRFINLLSIPIFGDEALYLWLADEFKHNPSTYLKSINYGVFPLTIWTYAFFETITGNLINPLLLGRTLQVLFDIFTAGFIFLIGKKLFSIKEGLISAVIYLSLPLTFFHSRFALLEPLTSLFLTAGIYFSLCLIKSENTLKNILLTSILITLAFFTKALAVVSYIAILLTPILSIKRNLSKVLWYSSLKITLVFIVTSIFMALFYLPISQEFTSKFVSSNNGSLESTLIQLKLNLWRTYWWGKVYLTLPITLLTITGAFFIFLKKELRLVWLYTWLIISTVLECVFAANFFPRHLFMLASPISLICSYFISRILKENLRLITLTIFLFLIPSLKINFQIITNPKNAPIALEDKQQLYEDWTSGEGLKEVAQKLKSYSTNQKILVFVEDDPNLIWSLPTLYDLGNTKLYKSEELLKGNFLNTKEVEISKQYPTYLILNRNPDVPKSWPAKLVFAHPKGPNRTINIYQLNSSK